ncbi:MAG: ATP-binding protein, partial [Bacteroidota bacterium]|nr:ATP-binding protein [Bacteroidota bacterium]
MQIEREEYALLKQRIEEPRRFLISISGPRQIGKTTMTLSVLKQLSIPYTYMTADGVDSQNSGWIAERWETIRTRIRLENQPEHLLVIDEIQKIENWSETVKQCWDEDTRNNIPLKVIVLGSSRMLLQQGLTESMAGRYEQLFLGHWSFNEMNKAFGFSVEEYVWYGGYPGAAPLIAEETRWRDYIRYSLVDSSINRDILMLTRIDKPALLKRVFELGCIYSSQILSFNKIIGQMQDAGNTTTLSHYMQLTDDAGLLGTLQKYSGSEIKVRSSIPKFQVYNNALFGAHQNMTLKEAQLDTAFWGRAVESAVGAHLINYRNKYRYELFYWREENDEVDFVVVHRGKLLALEVKSGKSSTSKGLQQFKKLYPDAKTLIVG